MPWRIVREKLSSMFGGLEEPEQRWRGCSLGSQEDAAGDRDRREAGAGPGPGRKTSGLAPADRGARRPEPGLPLAASTCGCPAVHPRDLTRSWCRPPYEIVVPSTQWKRSSPRTPTFPHEVSSPWRSRSAKPGDSRCPLAGGPSASLSHAWG